MVGVFFMQFFRRNGMAYSGFLIKVGDYKIPHSWIKAETYSVLRSGQDLDSYRDSNGKLHRTALEHFLGKVEFETPPLKTNTQVSSFMGNIRKQYTNTTEKKANVTFYVPELDEYMTQEMYMPDITFTIYHADGKEIKYNAFRLAFIAY